MAGLGGLVGGSALDDELKRSNVVRLRGLPFSATEVDIKEFFRGLDLGPDGIVICVNFQGRSTGQAYVQFATAELANKSLERNRQHIGSRYIEVFKGHPADMQGAMRMAGRGSSGAYGAAGLQGTGIPGMAGNPDMRFTGVVRMRGMPYSCTSADIMAFFKGMQVAPDGIFLCTHADGRPTGEAFVEFINEETAARAMQLHREPMGSRYVELFKSTKGEMMTSVQQKLWFAGVGNMSPVGSLGQIPGMLGGYGMQGVGALNLGAVQSPGPGAIGDISEDVCIKMRGLPYNSGPREITEFFQGYRIVPNGIYVVIGATDRPTGEAFVEFISSKEAQRAMERHRNNIGSRYIELFRATKSEMIVATGGLPFSMGQLDPALQLLLLQQQAAAGAFGMAGLLGAQGAGAWTDIQNVAAAAASFYQRQAGLTGSTAAGLALDPSVAATKLRSIPYRTSLKRSAFHGDHTLKIIDVDIDIMNLLNITFKL
ncbi:hypothetical protein SELMODRAFT_446014 [Selaginella moellendorffii]|uniref:RRM domain-containing protein n=1 Tax=Selaginella moellendorffii TaxID=88036 RepID=D8SMJ0_SELML|nr:hypothetical protein SELMODRAFT_446014 [Selaginella moellendorffii]